MGDAGNRRIRRGYVLRHASAVTGRVIFIGFSIQIVLGAAWMCRNFAKVQDFDWRNLGRTEPEGAVYAFYCFLGRIPPLVYLAQLGLALFAGVRLLRVLESLMGFRRRTAFSLWGSAAMLSLPFALQCHMAILPYSAMGSLFLLTLAFLLEAAFGRGAGKAGGKMRMGRLACAAVCGALTVALALEAGADEREAIWGRGADAAMASRMAWPSVWNDREYWPEELRLLTQEEELWRAAYCPGNMEIVLEAIEQRAGAGADGFYRQMAETAWRLHRPVILRQIGWDMLGYGAFPLVFGVQMRGGAYDSYTERNYEVMREHAPALTARYVKYSCWWFGCCLALAAFLLLLRLLQGRIRKRELLGAGLCALIGAVWVLAYTMRGAGLMDYRCSAAVTQLWLVWGILCMRGGIENSGRP